MKTLWRHSYKVCAQKSQYLLKIPYLANLPNWIKHLGNIGKKALLAVRRPCQQAGLECRTSHAMRPRPSSRSRALWLLCLCCTVYSKTLMLSRHKTKVGVGTRLMWEVFLAYRPLPSLKKNVRKAMTTAQQPLFCMPLVMEYQYWVYKIRYIFA